jgi:hypothetical protein
MITSAAVEIASGPFVASSVPRSWPPSSSITMNGQPFSVPTSDTRHTFSPRSRADDCASRMNRSTTFWFVVIDACMNLSATGVPSCKCVAANTMPIPPAPIMRSMRYLPATMVPVSYTRR